MHINDTLAAGKQKKIFIRSPTILKYHCNFYCIFNEAFGFVQRLLIKRLSFQGLFTI